MGERARGDEVDRGEVVVGNSHAEAAVRRALAPVQAHPVLEQLREGGFDLAALERAAVGQRDAQGWHVVGSVE
jgi:hypothetical protein